MDARRRQRRVMAGAALLDQQAPPFGELLERDVAPLRIERGRVRRLQPTGSGQGQNQQREAHD